MAPGIPGIPNDVQGPVPDAPFRRSPRCSDTSDEPENLSYAKHSILSDKLLTAYTRHGVDAVVDRLSAGGLDRRQPIGEHRGQDIDHLPIAVIDAGELAPYPLHGGRQHPVLEGGAVAQGAGLAGQHRHVMPRIVNRHAAAERATMFGDDAPVLADYDAIRIGMDLDRTPDGAGGYRVFVVVETHQAGLRDRSRHGVESIDRPA